MTTECDISLRNSSSGIFPDHSRIEAVRRPRIDVERSSFTMHDVFGKKFPNAWVIRKPTRVKAHSDEQSGKSFDRTDDRLTVHRERDEANLLGNPSDIR